MSLSALMHALDYLGDAARTDDIESYWLALSMAAQSGASEEQVRDAYQYGASARLRNGFPATTFDMNGDKR